MDPTGYYCILRLRSRHRGEKLNIGIIAFWRWGWALETDHAAVSHAASHFGYEEEDFLEYLDDLNNNLGFRAPGEFDPYYAYHAIHQYRSQVWDHEAFEMSTLRQIRIGHDGQYGYEGGVAEAAQDLIERFVRAPEPAWLT